MSAPERLGKYDSWEGVHAVVAGVGVSGFAAADNLLHLGAEVTVLDEAAPQGGAAEERATLLEILGGLFVAQTLSVMLQVGYFKLSGGRRMFRMAPLHHHFELLGWDEITVVVRFWIITGLCVAGGLGIFYAEWVAGA